MKQLIFLLFLLPLGGFSQSFTEFALNPNGDVSFGDFVEANGKLYFSAATLSNNKTGLWVTDGTLNQTMLFSQVFHGGNLFQYDMATLNGKLIFHAEPTPNDPVNGTELWTSDGTTAGTQLLVDINPGPEPSLISAMIQLGDELFFSADDGTHGEELWKTDGTVAGTMMVKDIQPGENGSLPTNFTVVGSTLYFRAIDEVNGFEIWKTDGTSAGTELVIDLNPGNFGSGGVNLTAFGTQLLFAGSDGTTGQELWITDGTAAGTVQVADVNPGGGNSFPSDITVNQGQIYFSANDGVNGVELWVSDGTATGTQLVKDLNPGAAHAYPAELLAFHDKVYFAATDGINGYEIWMTDGTEAGTTLLLDVFTGADGSNPSDLLQYGTNLYFTASTNASDRQLYQSDGSPAGTQIIAPASATNSNPMIGSVFSLSALYQGDLYFSASFTAEGRELWRLSDSGTAIEEAAIFQGMKIFPNPGADLIYVEMAASATQVEIEVLTLLGQVLSQQSHVGGGAIPVQWQGSPGLYLLRVQADGETTTRKIVRE
ncbi:MAG: T9SS type A sorting domain-containing protein [Bacteroidia bacterium]|nr:T9SS type A sorting domain-containing protein [Bacteroidia bacterium]